MTNETGQRTATINTSDSLKAVREVLCVALTGVGHLPALSADPRQDTWLSVLQRLIEDIDRQRPLGPDGKHGDRHTPTCGCVDGELTFELRMSLDAPAAPVLSPGDIVTITDPLTGDGKPRRYVVLPPLDSAARLVPESSGPASDTAVVDPTSVPQPRRWGTVLRGRHQGERVYWDAGLHARWGGNAWTNIDRTRRYSADQVRGDRVDP